MTTTDPTREPTSSADARFLRLESSLAELRNAINQLSQSQTRVEREQNNADQRLRDLEGRSISLAGEVGAAHRELDEMPMLRERINRFNADNDEHREAVETSVRLLRQEVDLQREATNDQDRRLQSSDGATSDLRDRLEVIDDAMRRTNAEGGEAAHRLSQLENAQVALDARISANADGVRRVTSDESGLESRIEALERQLGLTTERLDLSHQNLRRVEETAEQWEDLRTNVDALRGRVEEALRALDASRAVVSGVQRGFEAVEERIGDVERSSEQIRVRDSRRERAVAELNDRIESVEALSAQEQDRFVMLQEQIRRRQIEELEQEIRELKSYLRIRGDG